MHRLRKQTPSTLNNLKMMLVKHHAKDGKDIVAVCDKELIDQKFEENGKQLDLTSDFYKGEERDEMEIGDIIRNADIVNLVGKRAIELGLAEEVIGKENIVTIGGIPHAQAILIEEE